MALIKDTLFKGFPANYWTILKRYEDKLSNSTHVTVGLFKSKEYYLSIKDTPEWYQGLLEQRELWAPGIDLTREELYAILKISKPTISILTTIEPDPEDSEQVITVQKETEIETNFFADAEDDLN